MSRPLCYRVAFHAVRSICPSRQFHLSKCSLDGASRRSRGAPIQVQLGGAAQLGGRAQPGDMIALMKPRVMSLAVFTAAVGVLVAPDSGRHPLLTVVIVLAIAMGAGAAGALNMWFDSDIDARMRRTRSRPIPAGRVQSGEAAALGGVLSLFSVLLLLLAAPMLAGLLLAFTIFFYAVIYTIWLKRRTPLNIVIGGAAGALPPAIGWVAATGTLGWEPFALFLLIFLWTPPHFWALALYHCDDYEAASVPMLPNVKGAAATRRQILYYSATLPFASTLPWALGMVGPLYGVTALLFGMIFISFAVRLIRKQGEAEARALFGFSILYLFLLFILMPLSLP